MPKTSEQMKIQHALKLCSETVTKQIEADQPNFYYKAN
jgi:hypothetical protein